MSANPKRRDLELAVCIAALEWVRTGNMDEGTQAVMYAREDLRSATLDWYKQATAEGGAAVSANPKRRDLELAVIDSAIALDILLTSTCQPGELEDAHRRLHTAVFSYYREFGLAEPRRTRTVMSAPDTSHEAGEWMKQFALTDACTVFRWIYSAWRGGPIPWLGDPLDEGLTCDEVERIMDRTHQSMSARVNELRDTGWILDSGTRRKTRSGRAAIVWSPTRAALDLVDRAGLPIVVNTPKPN